jgi:hypothetical protein
MMTNDDRNWFISRMQSYVQRTAPFVGLSIVVGCGSTSMEPPRRDSVRIDLAEYSVDDVKNSPTGGSEIIGGMLLVDFDDAMSMSEIDATLTGNGLVRAGFVGGINHVTARITDGKSEGDALDSLVNASGVEGAIFNYVLRELSTSGATPPVLFRPQSPPPISLSPLEMLINWPHYVMDTFPAHALADRVLGGQGLSDVVVAVVDTGSFHDQLTDGSTSSSILDPNSGSPDVTGRIVAPAGIAVDPLNATASWRAGPADPSSNSLIGTRNTSDHGLQVSSAAVGDGEHVLGTGRHVRLKPVHVASKSNKGRCSNNPSIICDSATPCPAGEGSCIGITGVDYLTAALMELARNLDGTAAANLRVINISMGFAVDPAEAASVQRFLRAPLEELVDGGCVVVLAADDSPGDTRHFAPTLLAPARTGIRSTLASPESGLMLVAGSSLPIADILALQLKGPVNFAGLDFEHQEEGPWEDSASGDNVSVSAPAKYVPTLEPDFISVRLQEGNSFAAPYVAGIVAELFALDPTASNSSVLEAIEMGADTIVDPPMANRLGFGRVNMWKAVLRFLNRDSSSNPNWLGVRFRFAGTISPDERIFLNDRPVPDVVWRRVPDIPRDVDSNAREVPSESFLPASLSASFSFSPGDLDSLPGHIGLMELRRPNGEVIYQVPLREVDLLSESDRPLDTLLDDFVITFDVKTDFAAIYGRVEDENGQPIADAAVEYDSIFGTKRQKHTDSEGYYVIYDALPDTGIDLVASKAGLTSDATSVTVANRQAIEQNFVLGGQAPPQTSRCDFGTGLSTLRFHGETGDGGRMDEVWPDGSRFNTSTILFMYEIDFTLDTSSCTIAGTSQTSWVERRQFGCEFHTTTQRQWSGQLTPWEFGGFDVNGTVTHLATETEKIITGTPTEACNDPATTWYEGDLQWEAFLPEPLAPGELIFGAYFVDTDHEGSAFSFLYVEP